MPEIGGREFETVEEGRQVAEIAPPWSDELETARVFYMNKHISMPRDSHICYDPWIKGRYFVTCPNYKESVDSVMHLNVQHIKWELFGGRLCASQMQF